MRGPAYVVVALPDGRRRSLRRAFTDLAGAAGAPPLAPALSSRNGRRISVGTLLPLARHIVARLLGDLLQRMAPESNAVMEISRAERREQR